MGFCQHEAGGKEVSAFSDQALTDGACLRVVLIISVQEGKVRGGINKGAPSLGSSARPHTSLRGRYASARYVCLFAEISPLPECPIPMSFHRGSSAVTGLPLALLLARGLRGVSMATSSLSSRKMLGSLVCRTSCTSFCSSGMLLISICLGSFAMCFTPPLPLCFDKLSVFLNYLTLGCPSRNSPHFQYIRLFQQRIR